METGFFVQSDVHTILTYKNVTDAKQFVMSKINFFVENHPQTAKTNIHKATSMAGKSRSVKELAFAVQNFIMAHPSEGLSVIK